MVVYSKDKHLSLSFIGKRLVHIRDDIVNALLQGTENNTNESGASHKCR